MRRPGGTTRRNSHTGNDLERFTQGPFRWHMLQPGRLLSISATNFNMNETATQFHFRPGLVFLNHGSFGACPRAILEMQTEFRRHLEADPIQFMVHRRPELLHQSREFLSQFLHADPDGLAFIANATTGVNAVLRSLNFQPNDEILITDHGYNACSNTARYVAERSGAKVVVAEVPFPIESVEQVLDAILARVSHQTRLALVDHVTSPTGLVLPIERLVRLLHDRSVEVLVDGAHAQGMLPLNLAKLDADYYAGNCHKWLCAPKGVGFLYLREDHRHRIRPTVISHGYNAPSKQLSRFHLEFDWTGTNDPTAAICIPAAVEFMGQLLPGGWPEIMRHNRLLALAARKIVCDAFRSRCPCPEAMLGSLASIEMPMAPTCAELGPFDVDPLQQQLYKEHGIEVPIFRFPTTASASGTGFKPTRRLIRLSAHVYNELDDYRALADGLIELTAS